MGKYIDKEAAYDYATLYDWYIASVTDDTPVWTEEHLEELLNDFNVIPKDTPTADVVSMGVHQQVRWERDVAIEQLAEYGVGFGEKKKELVEVIRCGGCRYYNRRWGCRKLEINVSADNYCFMAEKAISDSEVVLPDEK